MKADRRVLFTLIAVTTACGLASAEEPQKAAAPQTQASSGTEQPAMESREPEHIKVQHVLIGFKGSVPGKPIQRTLEEARTLASSILERAKKGEDFDALVREFTDDSPPGIYAMANTGVPLKPPPPREFQRERMVAAFGDVGFKLAVGEIGMSDYDSAKSPYGYHIIKRLE